MKFICISDIHLTADNPIARLDNLVETQFKKLEWVLNLAKKENATILQAGDIFNKPRSWMLLPMVIDLLKKYNVDIYCVRGQHDDYMYSEQTRERTNLGILEKVGLIHPLSEEPTTIRDIVISGANFGQNLVDIKRSTFTVGVIHTSVSQTALWPDHKFTPADEFLAKHTCYDFILVGDIHRQFEAIGEDGRRLVNTGPMLRSEATEYNFDHQPSVFLLDTDNIENSTWIAIPHEKSSVVLSRDHIERKAEAEGMLDEFVVSLKEGADQIEGVSFVENLVKFIKDNSVEKPVSDVLARFIEKVNREGI